MPHDDFSIQYSGLNGAIRYSATRTNNALPNSEFEVHTHYDDFELYHFLKGDLFLAFEGKRIAIEEGSFVIICNGTLHRPIIKRPCCYYRKHLLFNKEIFTRFATIDSELYNRLLQRKILILKPDCSEKPRIDMIFSDIEDYISKGTAYDDFCALINLFSLLVKAEKSSSMLQGIESRPNSQKVSDIINYIDQNLTEDLNYKTIADNFYISQKSLYKFFKKETGFTLGNYINQRRITKAQSILNAGFSANDAAFEAGFKDYSIFYRNFLKEVGITPAKYIKNLSKK